MWELDYIESWAQKNWCFWTVVLEKTLESPLDCKEIQPAHPKGDQSWVFTGRTDVEAETPILWATWWEEPTHGKRPWGAEADDRGWGGWMASPTQWTGVWVNSRSWWWTGKPGVVRFMGLQRVGHNWASELNWTFRHPKLTNRMFMFVKLFSGKVTPSSGFSFEGYLAECRTLGCILSA